MFGKNHLKYSQKSIYKHDSVCSAIDVCVTERSLAGFAGGQPAGRGGVVQPGAQQCAAERGGRAAHAAAGRGLAAALAAAAAARPGRQRRGRHGRHHEPAGGRRGPRRARQLLRLALAPALDDARRLPPPHTR